MWEGSIQKIKILGEGTYGKCYLVQDNSRNELCVLKQIEIMGMNQTEIDQSVREARILESLSHPCIVKFLGSYQTKDGHLNILMNYADGGDLNQKIKEVKQKQLILSQSQILRWFTQMCLAVQHVHDRKIIHRDIKSQNIFLTREGDVKLGDFGIARPLELTLQKIKSVVGTPYYMSPQICQNKEYSLKTDIWSLGVILLQMCLLKPPFDANSLPALALKIAKGDYCAVPKEYSKGLKKLIGEMMQVDPIKRPSINQVLNNPLIRDKAAHMRFKDGVELQSSHSSLQQVYFGSKKCIGVSRNLLIDCHSEEHSSIQQVISPKNNTKNLEMPVKRIDNYMKGQKKGQRRQPLKKREASEPVLTPKGHSRIQNDRKVMVKNNSQVGLQKKKISPNPMCFKKKSKCKQEDVFLDLEQIHQFKNDIIQLKQQFNGPDHQQSQKHLSQEHLELDNQNLETPLSTLESIIRELSGENNLQEMYDIGQEGVYPLSKVGGLLTLAYGWRQ